MSRRPSSRTFAAILGIALALWSADAAASVEASVSAEVVPLLPSLEPLGELGIQGSELDLPCGPFLDSELRLTLFEDPEWWEAPAATIVPTWHTDKGGAIVHYDQIPRRWDRPSDYGAYIYPFVSSQVTSGYDLDLPDEAQRRGAMRAVGHGGVDLPQPLGTKITMIALAHQLGDPKVVHVGTLFGSSVVTLHAVREGGERAHYLLFFGHLDRAAPGLEPGQVLRAGELVGFVGAGSETGFVHLHLEARRVRDGIDPSALSGYGLVARDATIVTDPRNVLPTRALSPSSCHDRRRRAALDEDLRLTFELSSMQL